MGILAGFLFAAGLLFLLYYAIITIYAGVSTSFGWFWITGGICFLLISILLRILIRAQVKIPAVIGVPVAGIFLMGLLVFGITEAVIIYHASMEPEGNADYMIVLGAQVRGKRITKSLKARLDTAVSYLEDNEGTTVIVSGGQGAGEDISEAEAMKGYLIQRGIPERNIIMEDKSANTYENIRYSRRLMSPGNHKVVIVSNGFHIYRAVALAKKQKIGQAEGLAAPTDRILFISYYVREALAVIKEKLTGNI